jgi:hypothetical protein
VKHRRPPIQNNIRSTPTNCTEAQRLHHRQCCADSQIRSRRMASMSSRLEDTMVRAATDLPGGRRTPTQSRDKNVRDTALNTVQRPPDPSPAARRRQGRGLPCETIQRRAAGSHATTARSVDRVKSTVVTLVTCHHICSEHCALRSEHWGIRHGAHTRHDGDERDPREGTLARYTQGWMGRWRTRKVVVQHAKSTRWPQSSSEAHSSGPRTKSTTP